VGLCLSASAGRADVRVRVFNGGGGAGERGGNGVRCAPKYAYDSGLTRHNPLTVETGRGVLTLHLEVRGGKVEEITVDMGEPILEAECIPTTLSGAQVVNVPLAGPLAEMKDQPWARACGLDARLTCVSMGDPHAVLYCADVAKVPLEQVGPVLETAGLFPRRINVHFVQVKSPEEATMRTWERGSGVTLACGTGACAVCVAGVLSGRSGRRLLAHLPGGDLRLHWSESDNHVHMTGPATEVFSGEWA